MKTGEVFNIDGVPSFGEFFSRMFTSDFMPHGHCYFWRPDVLWLHVGSDAAIALSYYGIPVILIYFILKRKDIPFHWVFAMFGAFIFLCGTTHLIDIWTTWYPAYRFEGFVKLATAIVSVITMLSLIPLMPKVIALPGLHPLVEELSKKTKDLSRSNQQLARFNRITMGREKRILELKKEVNELCEMLGKKKPYDLT